jgi:(2Fe-2S) ferredoxin
MATARLDESRPGQLTRRAVSHFKRHFFICQTKRPVGDKPSCGQQGSDVLFSRLLDALDKRPELGPQVEVTACGCLGNCYDGPSMVVYPEGFWYAKLTPADLDEVIERHLIHGQPVERLKYSW